MRFSLPAVAGCYLASLATTSAHGDRPHLAATQFGLIGVGISMDDPPCAFACRRTLEVHRLQCSTGDEMEARALSILARHGGEDEFSTSSSCLASNDPFLLSLALCLQQRCVAIEDWILERFWFEDATSIESSWTEPVYGFAEAMRMLNVNEDTSYLVLDHNEMLETTKSVSDSSWEQAYRSILDGVQTETNHSISGIVLILSIIVLPILVHVLRLIPVPTTWRRSLVSHVGYSALFSKRHSVPLPYNVGIIPTKGQMLFILYVMTVNIVLISWGYSVTDPSLDRTAAMGKLISYVANRAGVLAYANLSLIFLASSRNNLAVSFTKWSYSTMLLYHRWIAYIAISQGLLHSAVWTYRHLDLLAKKFSEPYWIWGNIVIVLMTLAVVLSSLPVRKRAYEVFIDSHIIIAFVVLVGLYYHIYENFRHRWGYENWIYLAAVAWLVDRTFRVIKLSRNGIPTAHVTYLDDDYARIDVPGLKAAGHAYIYFPTLTWRVWQNHPFSIATSVGHFALPPGAASLRRPQYRSHEADEDEEELDELLRDKKVKQELSLPNNSSGEGHERDSEDSEGSLLEHMIDPSSQHDGAPGIDIKFSTAEDSLLARPSSDPQKDKLSLTAGVTFYVRRQKGVTGRLFQLQPSSLKVLIEGPYRPLPIPNIAVAPTLICIAGGVGISAILPALRSHALIGRTVLYWSSRSEALVNAVPLSSLCKAGVVVRTKLFGRWNVEHVVQQETASSPKVSEMLVLVSGPGAMADDVRAAVVKANSSHAAKANGVLVRLVEECFSW